MKKAALLVLVSAFGASIASAQTLKQASAEVGNFWSREAQRSGIHGPSASGIGNFLSSLNPVDFLKKQKDAYNERKTAAVKK